MPPEWSMEDLAPALAVTGLREQLHGHSLWWPWMQGAAGGACTLVAGLPAPAVFDSMLGPVAPR